MKVVHSGRFRKGGGNIGLGELVRGLRFSEVTITLDELIRAVQEQGEGRVRNYFYVQLKPALDRGAEIKIV